MNKQISFSFNALRFPLAILVVFIHSVGDSNASYYAFRDFVSHDFCKFAVPVFFIISGYLFFQKIESNFSLDIYKTKLHSRIYTLLLPYIFWNITALVLDYIKYIQTANSWIAYNSTSIIDMIKLVLWGNEAGYPINLPLWYIRELILLCIFSPLIFFLLTKRIIGKLFILILLVSYFLSTNSQMHITGLLYFTIGAFSSINNINIIYKRITILFIIALLAIIGYKICSYPILLKLYTFITCFVVISIAAKNNFITRIFCSLSKYSTIIYFSHYPISLIVAIKLINILHINNTILTYFITPIIAAMISIIILEIYQTIKRYAFRTT